MAGAVLILAIVIFMTSGGEKMPPVYDEGWFYDLSTKKLFTGTYGAYPPIDAPSGAQVDGQPAGVKAYVLACGPCESQEQFIGWLERYTPEGKQMADEGKLLEMGTGDYVFIRKPDAEDWVKLNSPDGDAITQGFVQKCAGKRLNKCRPGFGTPPG